MGARNTLDGCLGDRGREQGASTQWTASMCWAQRWKGTALGEAPWRLLASERGAGIRRGCQHEWGRGRVSLLALSI